MADGRKYLFSDDFDRPRLDPEKWLPFYLPHWSSRENAAARYEIRDGYIRLHVADDQAPWCPEFDGEVKVSNLQTGHWSGPVGSSLGQHRFREGLVVREASPPRRLFLPHYCALEMRARARLNPWNLAALWLIGFEDQPDRSGEITVFEAFGHEIESDGARIRRGIKKINDASLVDEIDSGKLPIDLGEWHRYAIRWAPSGVEFLVDSDVVTATTQSPNYPMQLMLNIYDLPGGHDRTNGIAATFDIDYVRAWELGG